MSGYDRGQIEKYISGSDQMIDDPAEREVFKSAIKCVLTELDAMMGQPEVPNLVEQRLAALLITIPGWQRNYTASTDAAEWMVAEAGRLGWEITVGTFPAVAK